MVHPNKEEEEEVIVRMNLNLFNISQYKLVFPFFETES